MPLYEYECDACGHRFEVIQKFSDPLADACPKCAGAVHKLFSSPAIQFKGSGFYITDYPKGDKGSAPKSDGGKADKAENAATPDASAKTDKTEASDKAGKADAAVKTDTSTKSAAASGDTSSSSASSTPAPSTSPASTKKESK